MKECMVLRDLFPLYREELLQKETVIIIEEHLLKCEECRSSYEKYCRERVLDEEQEHHKEEEQDNKLLKSFHKYRKYFKIMTGILAMCFVTIITLIVLLFTLVFTGGWAKTSKNIYDYPHILTEETNMRTGFFVFPEKITAGMTDITFDYYYKDTIFDPKISVFLQATYDEKQYQAEIDRLSNLQKVQGTQVKALLRDENHKYPYPVYIAVENHGSSYEYALLSGGTQITYVYTINFSKEDLRFEEQYLPNDFMNEEGNKFGSGYSIYASGQGSSVIVYDYTLDQK